MICRKLEKDFSNEMKFLSYLRGIGKNFQVQNEILSDLWLGKIIRYEMKLLSYLCKVGNGLQEQNAIGKSSTGKKILRTR